MRYIFHIFHLTRFRHSACSASNANQAFASSCTFLPRYRGGRYIAKIWDTNLACTKILWTSKSAAISNTRKKKIPRASVNTAIILWCLFSWCVWGVGTFYRQGVIAYCHICCRCTHYNKMWEYYNALIMLIISGSNSLTFFQIWLPKF